MTKFIFVTGFHRTGTSLVAGSIVHLGATAGKRVLGANPGNPLGHFENMDYMRINDDIIGRHTFRFINKEKYLIPDIQYTEETDSRMLGLMNKFKNKTVVLKDPRSCLTLKRWLSLIPKLNFQSEVKIITCIRHPIEVTKSFYKRDGTKRPMSHIVFHDRILEMYKNSYLNLFDIINKSPIVDYRNFLSKPREHLLKLKEFCGLEKEIDENLLNFVRRDLCHFEAKGEQIKKLKNYRKSIYIYEGLKERMICR